jgi:signal transduction histidine kinase
MLNDLERNRPSNPKTYILQIRRAAEQAASLTRQLLTFSRRQVIQPSILNLNETVIQIEKMLRRLIGEHINLRTILDPHIGLIEVDPSQLEQVIMNLAVNARDAMPDGGNLTIETANIYLDEGYAHQHVEVQIGSYVMLTVSDTGRGMDAETRARIFEPFFTTKEVGEGTGLGLSVSYSLIKQMNGELTVANAPQGGAIFTIKVPLQTEPEAD